MSGETILVAEDEDHVREVIATYLEDAGYRTVLACDGEEALVAAAGRPPDLVLADVNMPNLNGLQLARRLRSSSVTAAIPILMLSALSQPREILSGYSSGADEYVTKPVELAVLLAKVEALLARRPSEVAPPAGKVIAFLHAKGGVGATTVAVNVAAALSGSRGPARTCLLDFNDRFGSAAAFLGLAPLPVPAPAPGGPALDDLLLSHSSGVRLLAARELGDLASPDGPAALRQVLEWLRARFDFVLVDSGAGLPAGAAALAQAADLVCVLTSAGRASLEATRELLDALDGLPVPAGRQRVVVNRLSAGLDLGQAVQILRREPVALITASDLHAVAADSGQPLVTTYRGHAAALELEQLAGSLRQAVAPEAGGVATGLR